jgi:lincosamide and streptogramin A transport system ATP-binding/permease protein
MSQINVSNLTFYYDGSYDNIFENVSFSIDTNWKLGFIGRNGRGKTTFLNLLLGKYEYRGSIAKSVVVDYFPYPVLEEWKQENTIEVMEHLQPEYELWKICRELTLLQVDSEVLYRPFNTLSFGEQTKVLLALLFSQDNHFLLIDEPTNHLDMQARELVKDYLNSKKGFILISHDRYFLDSCIDHVLVINRADIVVEVGNFSSWWENKRRQDEYELAENDRLKKDIIRLEASARRTSEWADKVEGSKIGFNPLKKEKSIDSRAYIGEKSRRMQQRRKNLEHRQQDSIEEKKQLLKNLETVDDLKLFPLEYHKERLIEAKDFAIYYDGRKITKDLNFTLNRGERIVLRGGNGCGKSSVIKYILGEQIQTTGELAMVGGLKISYVSQDTSHLKGSLPDYIKEHDINESLFKAILRKLDFERLQFDKTMENFSGGQKKKVLLATSLCEQAHLYIWDEPLNFVDIFSRMQLEQLIEEFKPTMLLVEHDKAFVEKIATKIIEF